MQQPMIMMSISNSRGDDDFSVWSCGVKIADFDCPSWAGAAEILRRACEAVEIRQHDLAEYRKDQRS